MIESFDRLKSPEINKLKNIVIIGGGPAGALAGFLLRKNGFQNVTIFEPRLPKNEGRKTKVCTGCAGVIQPEVVDLLRDQGLDIPEDIIQERLGCEPQVHLPNTELIIHQKKGPVAVYRGFAPIMQSSDLPRTNSFDAWLLNKAIESGAKYVQDAISKIDLQRDPQGKMTLTTNDGEYKADFVIGAYGHSTLTDNIHYPLNENRTKIALPKVSKSAVREFFLGKEKVDKLLGNNMHIFGNPTDKIWFAMIVPKGNFFTAVIMGRGNVKSPDMNDFLESAQVKKLLNNNSSIKPSCGCFSTFTTESPSTYMVVDGDGICQVNIGDAGPTRPMKNGMGAAMDSAVKLVETISKYGLGREATKKYKRYIDSTYVWDNLWAKVTLALSDRIMNKPFLINSVKYILDHDMPFLTEFVNSIIDNIVSGKKPYWQIPFIAVKQLFSKSES